MLSDLQTAPSQDCLLSSPSPDLSHSSGQNTVAPVHCSDFFYRGVNRKYLGTKIKKAYEGESDLCSRLYSTTNCEPSNLYPSPSQI